MKHCSFLALGFLLCWPLAVPAQQPVTIPNSAVYDLHSKINQTDYRLFLILPRSYAVHPERRYPVFYMLDGNDTALIGWLARSRQHSDTEEVIFAGVGYPEPLAGPPVPLPGQPAVPPAQRSADYALANTTEPWSPPADKGAPVFLRVLEQEIVPFVDAHFRTNTAERALGGHSLGGLFTTYALFHATLFQKFWIGSPSLRWDNSVCFRYEAEYAATHHDLNARVIQVAGGQESKTFNRDPLFAMMDAVKGRRYPHLVWKTVVFPNEDHGALPLAAMPQITEFLFGPPAVELTPGERAAIEGNWKLPDGKLVRIFTGGGLLFATGLPFLSNTDPQREQFLTPLGNGRFLLRTLLNLDLKASAAGPPQLVLRKMHAEDTITAVKTEAAAQ